MKSEPRMSYIKNKYKGCVLYTIEDALKIKSSTITTSKYVVRQYGFYLLEKIRVK